jgi:predicted enzyme related to lactoylglutathione lyase
MNYTVVKVGGNAIGGIMAIPQAAQGMPPSWTTYVTVDDVDKTAKQAQELGGKILMGPQDIPTVGLRDSGSAGRGDLGNHLCEPLK